MQATRQYFTTTIAETVSKAMGVPVKDVRLGSDGEIVVVLSIEDVDALFWNAVREQAETS